MTKKLKLLAVISVIWVLAMFAFAADEAGSQFRIGDFLAVFVSAGLIPLAVLWGIVWIFRKPTK